MKINVPLTVPKNKQREYKKNYKIATHKTGKVMLFAGDQKIEHLNDDFYGEGIPEEVADPEHFFRIAEKAHIGVFASQIGLIARYGRDYKKIPYVVKINSKTNLLKEDYKDAFSNELLSVKQVVDFKEKSKLKIVGVGCTVYLGSWYTNQMLKQATQMVYQAHQEGLLAIVWMYSRGKGMKTIDNEVHLTAGGSGIALCLGADFVKVKYPYSNKPKQDAKDFQEVVQAAGRTNVICSGGAKKNNKRFLTHIHNQIHIAGTKGAAVARNIYQRPLDEAIRMANAISAITLYNYSAADAYSVFLGEQELDKKN